ncbi:MAG: methyltransferase domain-containing protein [Candidatus Pacebacteria bacterium]|nr:methyltransferase domain-containing protein [Candidatus Paceibacterota bacterium]
MTNPHQTANFAHPPRNVGALGIEPGMVVADFGSGSGAYVHLMAERLAHAGHVYAIDVQQDLLRRIKNDSHKRGYTNVETVWGDLERPHGSKIVADHVDRVLISNLLFQLEDKDIPLAEAFRILKPNGLVAIVDWSESFGGLGPQKQDVVKKEAAIKYLKNAGFELVREFDAGAHHYGLIGKKPIHV